MHAAPTPSKLTEAEKDALIPALVVAGGRR